MKVQLVSTKSTSFNNIMLSSHLSGLSCQILSDTKSLLEFRGDKVLGAPSFVIVIVLLIFLNVKPESEYIGNY